MNLRQLAYGLLSFVPGIPESLYRGTGGTNSAEYCYCIWLRHLLLARSHGMTTVPRIVAELGPGDSIGVGLAALLSGAERYVAFDAMRHADSASVLSIFDRLVELFEQRAPVPGNDRFPELPFDLPNHDFPHEVLTEGHLRSALAPERIERLRALVAGSVLGAEIDYRAPWDALLTGDEGSVDLLLSNAVMEHVADLPTTYRTLARWLRPGGFASHQIDFRSHGLFRAWDGHWQCPDWLWRLFVGKRLYLLNRAPLSTHLDLATKSGLSTIALIKVTRTPEAHRVARRFRGMSLEDRATCGAYILQQKPDA